MTKISKINKTLNINELNVSEILVNAHYFYNYIGGLVGFVQDNSSISGNENSGNDYGNYSIIQASILVNAKDNAYIGGLIGYNKTSGNVLTNMFNLGEVSVSNVTLLSASCSSVGIINLGGLVGYSDNGTYKNVYNALIFLNIKTKRWFVVKTSHLYIYQLFSFLFKSIK